MSFARDAWIDSLEQVSTAFSCADISPSEAVEALRRLGITGSKEIQEFFEQTERDYYASAVEETVLG